MPRLIIGHTTDRSVRLWVRGDAQYPIAFVSVSDGQRERRRTLELEERHFHTGAVDVGGLEPYTWYSCRVMFGRERATPELHRVDFGHCEGRFCTFPEPGRGAPLTFLLGSCNLHTLGFISSPEPAYERITALAELSDADFMIHCGDQIYYDVPWSGREPSVERYRKSYLDAWSDSRATRKLLTRLPHYMILDDHEIANDFALDRPTGTRASQRETLDAALKVYREFVHIRHPSRPGNQALWYEFAHGGYRFFVVDTRTERYLHEGPSGQPQIVGADQLRALLSWLRRYRDDLKFVVTSVPFVGEVRGLNDKWSAPGFRHQREAVMAHLLRHRIGGVTFLTGDMHCSYHGTLALGDGSNELLVHELMASPVNQLDKRPYDRFEVGRRHTSEDRSFTYTSTIRRGEFFGDHSNVMLVRVRGRQVAWEIHRTKKARLERRGQFTLRERTAGHSP